MLRKKMALLSALCLAAVPAAAAVEGLDGGSPDGVEQDSLTQGRSKTGGQSYGDRNRGGRSGFYSFPRHRHVDGASGGGLLSRPFSRLDAGTSPYCDHVNCHGSAWYGRDYGAPYHGGGYVDRGVYYRERRD